MQPNHVRCVLVILFTPVVISFAMPRIAAAVDLDGASFGLRFQSALTRFPRYPDLAGLGGASVASKWSSSINPASTDWQPALFAANIAYTGIPFDAGTNLHVASQAIAWKTEDIGTFQPSLLQVWSNTATTRQDLEFEFDAYLSELQWGKRFDETAIGLNFNHLYSKINFDTTLGSVVESTSNRFDLRAGILHELTESTLVGLVLEYGILPIRTKVLGASIEQDTAQLFLVRPGIALEYLEDSILFLDYQYGVFWDDTGTLNTHMFQIGVEHKLWEPLYVRGGTALDTEGNVSVSAGIGLWLSQQVVIDVGYQYDNFPQLQLEFGRSHLFAAGLTIFF